MAKRLIVLAACLAAASLCWSVFASMLQGSGTTESFNLGVEAARRGQHGLAIAALERVLFYQPHDDEARDLLRGVRDDLQEKLSKEHARISENHGTALESLGAVASPRSWEILLFLSVCLSLCGFATALQLEASNLRTAGFSISWLLVVAALTAALGWAGKRALLSPGKPAIVIAEDAELLQNPDSRAEKTAVLLEGERVWLVSRYADFVQVSRGEGVVGWTPEQTVRSIALID